MPDAEDVVDLEANFAWVAQRLFSHDSVAGTLQQIVDLAATTVEGCDAAGILVVDDGLASTVMVSAPHVGALDQLQIDADEGPCLNAALGGTHFYAEDLADDLRWPTFGPAAVRAGVRSVLAYSLFTERPSALNLYSRFPLAFGATDRAQGVLFATLAGIAVGSATAREADERRADNLREALLTRELIGQAQGILIERERITPDEAFAVLRRASQALNVKLRDVAATLVETGESPTPTNPEAAGP